MVLNDSQIERYSRQIILSEIGGRGQERLLGALLRLVAEPDLIEQPLAYLVGAGVGSIAIALLAARGFRVVAATGKPGSADYLKRMGAAEVIDRKELSAPGKPLQSGRWAGAAACGPGAEI